MSSVLLVLQLIVAIFLVVVILLQRSNGGALSGLGGDSGIGGLLSARGKGNILTRITAILATLFFALSMAISIYFSRVEVKRTSIVDGVVASNMPAEQTTNEVAADVEDSEANTANTDSEAPIDTADESVTNTEGESAEIAEPQPSDAAEAGTDEPQVPVAE